MATVASSATTSSATVQVYVDNTLRYTISATAHKYLMVGTIAGTPIGGGFAAGSIAIT